MTTTQELPFTESEMVAWRRCVAIRGRSYGYGYVVRVQKAVVHQPTKVITSSGFNLFNSIIRDRLQAHIDFLGRLHPLCSPDEYAALFEEVYPVEADRRSYLDAKVAGAKPSYGHLALVSMSVLTAE